MRASCMEILTYLMRKSSYERDHWLGFDAGLYYGFGETLNDGAGLRPVWRVEIKIRGKRDRFAVNGCMPSQGLHNEDCADFGVAAERGQNRAKAVCVEIEGGLRHMGGRSAEQRVQACLLGGNRSVLIALPDGDTRQRRQPRVSQPVPRFSSAPN
jgi:hypothetical protein